MSLTDDADAEPFGFSFHGSAAERDDFEFEFGEEAEGKVTLEYGLDDLLGDELQVDDLEDALEEDDEDAEDDEDDDDDDDEDEDEDEDDEDELLLDGDDGLDFDAEDD